MTKTCPVCGNEFKTKMPKKQTYCTPECRAKARTKRQDETLARFKAERQTYTQEIMDALKRDNYTCTKCGRSHPDVDLIVVPNGAGLKTLCVECAGE